MEQTRRTRRAIVAAGVATTVGGTALAQGTASPVATPSPSATPAATPAPTATPPVATAPTGLRVRHESDRDPEGEPRRGGTLRLPVTSAGLTAFVPALQRQDPLIAWSCFDPLVRIDPRTLEPRPGLATSWAWSPDGLSLTFELRDDVRWHDDTPFTADDARFSHLVARDDVFSAVAGQSALVTDLLVDGPHRLRVAFEQPDGAWLYNVASLPVIQRAQYLRAWEALPLGERTLDGVTLPALPVGTGAWRVVTVDPGGVALEANADWWDESPLADRLELHAVDDLDQRISRWRQGGLDLVPDLPPGRIAELRDDHGVLIGVDAARSLFAAFNVDNPARIDPSMLADPTLRQALSLALDRAAISVGPYARTLRHEGVGVVAQPWAHDANLRSEPARIAQARTTLQIAGWADIDGDGVLEGPFGDDLILTALVLDSVGPEVLAALDLADAQLRRVGAGIVTDVLDRDAFIQRWRVDRTWDLLAYDLRLYPAFAEFDLIGSAWDSRVNPRGWNPGGYANPAADAAILAYFEAVDQPDMVAALADLQRAVVDDPFALWLGFPRDLLLVSHHLRGVRPHRMLAAGDTRLMWREDG